MPDDRSPPPSGHNNPPPYRVEVVQAHEETAAEFLSAAGDWLDVKEIANAEHAGELVDFITGVKDRIKEAEADRVTDKKPHDDAGKAVQKAYINVIDRLKLAITRVAPMQTAWLEKLEAKKRAEAEEKAAAARKAQDEAARLARQAEERNDVSGQYDAEQAAKVAKEAQKEAARAAKQKVSVKSASGGGRATGFRTTWRAEITNLRLAVMHFQNNPEFTAMITHLAETQARAKDFDPTKQEIPGIKLNPERKAI